MMETTIIVALIAALASIIVALWNFRATQLNQRDIEVLRDQIEQQKEERNARLDYEYEARKRLYLEYEPLRFHLIDASENAFKQIAIIAEKASAGNLGPGGWSSKNSYFLKAMIYNLLAPAAMYKVIQKRLTFIDLQVDPNVHLEYILAKSLYQSFINDFQIASLLEQPYEPYVEGWREKRKENPRKFRRQGFPVGRLDNALDELIIYRDNEICGVTSFGQYEEKLNPISEDDVRSGLGVARDMFFDFYPDDRPVLWHILLVQFLIYRAIIKTSAKKLSTAEAVYAALIHIESDDLKCFHKIEAKESFRIPLLYIDKYIKPSILGTMS